MKLKFKKAVERGDLISTRLYLSNELLLDPRGYSFHEMLDFAETIFAEKLYESHNGKSYSQTQDEWNKDFLLTIKDDLDDNFSKERLLTYETIAKVVLKDKATLLIEEESGKQKEQQTYQKREHQKFNNRIEKKTIYGGVTIGGIALTAAGLYDSNDSKSSLIFLGVAGIVVGGVLLYKEFLK